MVKIDSAQPPLQCYPVQREGATIKVDTLTQAERLESPYEGTEQASGEGLQGEIGVDSAFWSERPLSVEIDVIVESVPEPVTSAPANAMVIDIERHLTIC